MGKAEVGVAQAAVVTNEAAAEVDARMAAAVLEARNRIEAEVGKRIVGQKEIGRAHV
jgi:hypothetical protein